MCVCVCSLSMRSNLGGKAVISRASMRRTASAAPLQVQAARSAASKVEVVAALKETVSSSLLVAGLQYQGLSVRASFTPRAHAPAEESPSMPFRGVGRRSGHTP